MSFKRYPSMTESGVEWLGDIPSHWAVSKFRHAFIESAEKIESDVFGVMLSVSGYRGIEVKEYDDANRRRLDEEVIGYRIVRPGQLVVNTMWLNYAGLGVSDYEGHVSPAYRAYWITEGLDRRFVHHMMRSELFVRGYTKFLTGVRPNSLQMGRDDLMGFQLLKPPQEEQRAIAAFLDRETAKIDALVEEQKRLIELLKEKRQAVISQAVTKGLDPSVPMKDSGVAWLGEVPDAWSVKELKRMVVATNAGEVIDRSFWGGSSELLYSCALEPLDCDYEGFPEWKRTGEDDLLVTRNGTPYVHKPGAGSIYTNVVQRITLAPLICRNFMAIALQNAADNLRGYGVSIESLNYEMWKALPIAVPPLPEQTTIAAFLDRETDKLAKLITEAQSASALLQERRSALISAAVTGKIDVRGLVPQPEVTSA